MALALPSGASASASSPAARDDNDPKGSKKRKRVRPSAKDKGKGKAKDKDKEQDKERDYDSDAELEISAEDLVAAGEAGEDGPRGAQGDGEGPEDTDDEENAAAVGIDVKRQAKRRRDEIQLLRSVLDEEQAKRYDTFRSVVIPKAVVRKLNRDMYDQNVTNNLTAVLAGMVKVFVADVVETARELQPTSEVPDGPLQPYHLQVARMRLQDQGLLATPAGIEAPVTSTGLRRRRRLLRK